MRTWRSTDRWELYVPVPAFEAWRQVQASKIADRHDDATALLAESRSLSDAAAHSDSVRAFARILRAAETSRDGKLDRLLAKRTDALGALFARAPKRERKAA